MAGKKTKKIESFTKKLETDVEIVLAEEKITNQEPLSVDTILLT